MKPASFRYVAPSRLDDVIGLLEATEDGRVIAGGQSLVPMMAMRLAQPELLVDLRKIPQLHEVEHRPGVLVVGAMVSQAVLGRSAAVHPLVRLAIPLIGHAQIRNRGTVCGSLAHADPAAELPAVAVALGARVEVRGPSGTRSIEAGAFFVSYFTSVLEEGEVVTSVEVPSAVDGEGWAFEEVSRRHGDFALAGVAVRLTVDDSGALCDAAVVPFAVGARPAASRAAHHLLRGALPSPELFAAAATAAAGELEPPSDVHASSGYRRHAVEVLTRRALGRAVEVATSRLASLPSSR